MANITYSSKNNTCSNLNNGSIHINQINFDNNSEARSFLSYSIQWSGPLSPNQISSDHRSIENLSPGLYSFSLYSLVDSSIIGPYNIEISSPDPLSIVDCTYSGGSCNTNDGVVTVSVVGGVPPYSVLCGIQRVTSLDNNISLSGINSGDYHLKIVDSNGCSIVYDKILQINNKTLSAHVLEVVSPTLLDSYGIVKLRINGDGPFNFEFINNNTQETILIDQKSSTRYITKKIEDKYYYRIDDKIPPGSYLVKITNEIGCLCVVKFVMTNLEPIRVELYPERFNQYNPYSQHHTAPILDTILIPFFHIQQNTTLWQFVKNLELKDKINIKTNNNNVQYAIVRNMSDKQDLDMVEVLRLGPDSKNWFFYFHIAPGISINTINDLLYEYKLINKEEEYKLTVGSIDQDNPSIIKGSFIIHEAGLNQFCNRDNNVYISLGINNEFSDYNYYLTSSSKQVYKTLYNIGHSTIISFLEDKKTLNKKTYISETTCSVSEDEYNYMLSIYEIINYINNTNNIFNIYIYNSNTVQYFNRLRINIIGNESFILEDKQKIYNEYKISYLLFDELSTNPETIDQNKDIYKGNLLDNIKDGYIIVKLQDLYNNKIKIVNYNNLSMNYDTHYTEASNLIKNINNKISSYFNYGDILVYIGTKDTTINIPHNIIEKNNEH